LRAAAGWLLLAVIAAAWPACTEVWLVAGALLALAAVVDAAHPAWRRPLAVEREIADALAVGVWSPVLLRVRNETRARQRLSVFDGVPAEADVRGQPHELDMPAAGWAEFEYEVRVRERGPQTFARTHLLRRSAGRMWLARQLAGAAKTIKVYPNYAPVVRYALLALENRQEQMGIKKKPLRGLGKSFHQLREYREGDLLQQIDWKATSRRRELISREYQEERDQQILFIVDCGRRMRSIDGRLSHFDHCLNALLLVSYVALRQGDSVGLLSFAGSERWLPPVKGPGGMSVILNQVYDYRTTDAPSDYTEAARRALTLQRRRSMIVLMTNLRGEDAADLAPAVQSLRRRHLVVVASLREAIVDERLAAPIEDFEDALLAGSSAHYLGARRRVIEKIRGRGIYALDLLAEELPVALAQQYLDIKQAGAL
jgi:uncharacterized protein (DUF58 family)